MPTDAVVRLARPEGLDAWEPLRECVVACEIFERFEMREAPDGARRPVRIWQPRTYRFYRHGSAWRIDFGEGGHEPRADWTAIVDWFCKMQPRAIEVLIDQMLDEGKATP